MFFESIGDDRLNLGYPHTRQFNCTRCGCVVMAHYRKQHESWHREDN